MTDDEPAQLDMTAIPRTRLAAAGLNPDAEDSPWCNLADLMSAGLAPHGGYLAVLAVVDVLRDLATLETIQAAERAPTWDATLLCRGKIRGYRELERRLCLMLSPSLPERRKQVGFDGSPMEDEGAAGY